MKKKKKKTGKDECHIVLVKGSQKNMEIFNNITRNIFENTSRIKLNRVPV